MSKYFLIISFLFLIILNKSKLGLCEECKAYFYKPSEIRPVDDVQLLVSETLRIDCRVPTVTSDCNSAHLVFQTKNGEDLSNNFNIVDNSTIQLFIRNMTAFNSVFNCKYKNKAKGIVYGLGQVDVRVGYKPKISKCSCFSINLGIMECTIEQISNPLIIDYAIEYGPTDEDGEIPNRISTTQFSIEEQSKVRFTTSDLCSRGIYKYCYIKINLDNGFGSDIQTYWIHVGRITKPIIQNFAVNNITSKSAILIWSLSPYFTSLDVKFQHQIKICQSRRNCNNNSPESWQYMNTQKLKEINRTTFKLKINLDYAYTWYDVQVSTSVRDALYDDLWSHANGTVFQTLKRKPDSPPEVAIGGFEILPNNETKIYWKETSLNKWNADYMTYEISKVLENGYPLYLQPEYNDNNTTAKFHGLQHTDRDYQFEIISRNSEGKSSRYSVITIPRKDKRIKMANRLKKHVSNSVYTLTWHYSNALVPDNYTIFWCDPIDEQGTLCGKLLNFTYVQNTGGNTFTYNNTHDKKTKIFAISANKNGVTSGMEWFPCSVTENQDMTIFPAELEVMGATRINVSWSPQCATPLLKGFNISYCPIYNPNLTECNETKLYSDVSNSYYIIENLLAYTTYLVKISMFDGKKSGPIVELRKVTDSCQPTVPYDFGYERITNSSITLNWSPPDYWNGEPQFYEISYKLINKTSHQYQEKTTKIEKLNDGTLPRSFELTNLYSYSDYIIKIAGCNPACSNFSNEIKIQTLIGKPGLIDEFDRHKVDGFVTYTWSPPKLKAGHIDFYEILFEGRINMEYRVIQIIQMKSTKCTVANLCQNLKINDFKVSVRSINIVDYGNVHHTYEMKNKTYQLFDVDTIKCTKQDERVNFECGTKYNCIASDWSATFLPECSERSNKIAMITIASFCIGFGMLIGVTLVCKKVQQVKDVGKPELPEGLEGIMEAKPSLNNIVIHNKPKGNAEDEQKRRLISESKSLDDWNIYLDYEHFVCDMDNSEMLSAKQLTTNSLNHQNVDYEANSISNYNYDAESIDHSDNMSYDNTQSTVDSNIQLTESTNTDSNYIVQPATGIKNSPIITTNGYVCPTKMPIVSNGYVQIADLPPSNVGTKLPVLKRDMFWLENGYVKPKDLVGFESRRNAN